MEFTTTEEPQFLVDKWGITPETADMIFIGQWEIAAFTNDNPLAFQASLKDYPVSIFSELYRGLNYWHCGEYAKAMGIAQKLVSEHPDFIEGVALKALICISEDKFDEAHALLGKSCKIDDRFPAQEYHAHEVLNYYHAVCQYFIATNKIKNAKSAFDHLIDADWSSEFTENINELLEGFWEDGENRLEEFYNSIEEELEDEDEVLYDEDDEEDVSYRYNHDDFIGYDEERSSDVLPEFIHPEIWKLYESGLRIDTAILKEILLLPRPSLVRDLRNVLKDAIARYNFFEKNEEQMMEKDLAFPLHAIWLLGELKAVEALPDILDFLALGDDFTDLWLGEFKFEMWQVLVTLSEGQLPVLYQFLCAQNIHFYVRAEVARAFAHLYRKVPEQRMLLTAYFRQFLELNLQWIQNGEFAKVSPDLNGYVVSEIMDLRLSDLLSDIVSLYEYEAVDLTINGELDDVVAEMESDEDENTKFDYFGSIFTFYDNVLTTWDYYMEKEDLLTPDELREIYKKQSQRLDIDPIYNPYGTAKRISDGINPFVQEDVIGRNDPCPCGSGKKYKKCCMKE
jgi:hypothetical protein